MNTFNNFKVGTKIRVGFIILLVIMTIISAVAVFHLSKIRTTVTDLTDNLAGDQHMSDQMVANILQIRFYAHRYLRTENSDELNRFHEELARFEALLAQADKKISQTERVKMLATIKQGVQDYRNYFSKISQLMSDRHQLVWKKLNVVGPKAENQLEQLRENAWKAEDATTSFYASNVQRAFLLMRLNAAKYFFQQGNPQWYEELEKQYQSTQIALNKLNEHLTEPTRRQLVIQVQTSINQYYQSFVSSRANYFEQNQLIKNQLNVIGQQVRKTASEMSANVGAEFEQVNDRTQALVAKTQMGLLIAMMIAIIVGLGLGIVISRSITVPLMTVIEMMEKMMVGHLNQRLDFKSRHQIEAITSRSDELGDIGRAFNSLADYFQAVIEDLVQVSQGLAEGRLRVTPKAEYRGEFVQIKNALQTALSDLGRVIHDIVQLSQGLADGNQKVVAKAEYRGDFVQIKNALEMATTKLAEATAKNRLQDWLKTGQTRLNEKMRGEQDVMTLAKNIITFITTYLEAQVGVFYLLEEIKASEISEAASDSEESLHDGVRLKLIASYAYSQRKGLPNEYRLGEGLIGQVALEQETILVTEVPEDYISIQSGSGEAVPRNLLVTSVFI
jgi:methyl-accepting chemotaxis protein